MKKKAILIPITALALVAGSTGCSAGTVAGTGAAPAYESAPAETSAAQLAAQSLADAAQPVVIEDQAVPLYSKPAGSYVRTPIASGTVTYENNLALLDASNMGEGYIMLKYLGSNPKIKVQITKSGSTTYTYDLNNSGVYEVFPLSEGSGSYQVKVFENVSGNQYSQAFSQDVSANITNEFGPFLYPNQYVNFNAASAAVQTGAAVCAGSADQVAVVADIYNYVITNITYDTAKAASVQSGYLPNVDVVLAQKKGICFDYAALMTAMLRSQDIPTKLVVGYTGNLYHAWINVYLDGQGWVDNVIYFDGHDWKLMDPTFASSGNQSEEIMKYIGNGSNYQGKYSY